MAKVQGSLAIAKSPKLKALQLDMEERLPQAFVAIHSSLKNTDWLWSHVGSSTVL